MADADTDRNLLFGVLAMQQDLINRHQFADACAGWAICKETLLADILIDRGWITAEDRRDVERFLERKLKRHGGDVRASLAAAADSAARDAIRTVDDAEVRNSLSSLPPATGYVLVETLIPPSQQRSRYRLTRLHAVGGLGKVWLAHDDDLNRDVALKEIQPERAGHPEAWRRFLKEAQITGQLEHPGIVPVYELARRPEDDQPFYTMRFVKGGTLRQAISDHQARRGAEKADPLERFKLLQSFIAVCQAVGYAHSRGVIHRDLKPENVVLDNYGVVMVLDWGLARMVNRPDEDIERLPDVQVTDEAKADATRANALLGTPAYMAPEQAEGRNDLVDVRTDVYGLGAILFEILTGRPPHEGTNTAELLRQIATGETPRARTVAPSVHPALDAVCFKAMAKSRIERYQSASDLAEEVQRWVADEPVHAWREPLVARLGRRARRHRVWVISGAALGLILTIAGLWKAKAEIDYRNARAVDQAGRRAAEESERVHEYHARIDTVRASRSQPRNGWSWQNLEHLKTASAIDTPERDFVDIRGEAAQCLTATDVRLVTELNLNHGMNTGRLAFSPDGKLIAAAEFKAQALGFGRIKLFDVTTGNVIHEMTYNGENVLSRILAKKRSQERICDIAFSPDGRWLAAGMGSGRVLAWRIDRPSDQPVVWYAHTSGLTRIQFGADSRTLWTTSGGEKAVKLWRNDGDHWSSDHPAATLAFAGEAADLALGASTLWVSDRRRDKSFAFDATTFAPMGGIAGLGDRLALSPDGRILVGSASTEIRLASTGRREIYRSLKDSALTPETSPAHSDLQFDPNGGWIASCVEGENGRVNLWDLATGRLAATIPWSSKGRGSCAVSPDGRLIAVTGIKQTLVYEIRASDVSRSVAHVFGRTFDVAWVSPDVLACIDTRSGTTGVSLWNASTGQSLGASELKPKPVSHRQRLRLAAHPSGKLAVQTWGETYLFVGGLNAIPERISARFDGDLAFTPDGASLWGISPGEWIDTWSVAGKRLIPFWQDNADFLEGRSGMNGLAVGARWVIAAGADGYLNVLDTLPGAKDRVVRWGNGRDPFLAVALDRTETAVASGSQLGRVQIWRLPGGDEVSPLDAAHRDAVEALDFAPDSRMLATGSLDGGIRLWEPGPAGRWTESLTLATAIGPIQRIRFNPDGCLLAVIVRNESAVHIWDLKVLNERTAALGLGARGDRPGKRLSLPAIH